MELENFKLGEHRETLAVDSLETCTRISLLLTQQATHSLYIFTRDMDERLYDTEPFIEAVRQLAIRGRHSEVRILVQQPDHGIKNDHRLIELSRRLSSHMAIRTVHPDFRDYNEAFLIVDDEGFVHRPLADRFEGKAGFHDPLEARELKRFFIKVWEMSSRDPQHLRLHI